MIGQYYLNFVGRMTDAQILKAISVKQAWNVDIGLQLDYYLGRNPPILKTDLDDKVSVPFGRKLVKSVIGFMFKEGNITYKYPDDKQELKDRLESVFKCNREQTENVRLGRDQARFGSAFEILYVNSEDAHPQFRSVHANQVIPIYHPQVDSKMAAAINFYTLDDYDRHIDVYYPDVIQQFRYVHGGFVLYNEQLHYFGDVPVIEFRNNDEGEGDIESVESMIDAYDKLVSNSVNEDDKFSDALLLLKNCGLSDDQIKKIERWRILDDLDEDAEVSYLTKPNVFDNKKELIDTIEEKIYSMSGIPKLDDKDAMSQQSGEALKYIYAGFENMVAGDKQSGFNEGLQRRLRLICNYLNWLEGRGEYSQDANNPGTGYDADDIEIRWVRNLPAETTTKVTNTMAISTVVSRRTVLENLHEAGMVSDVDAEMKRLEEESALDLGTEDQLAKESYGSL